MNNGMMVGAEETVGPSQQASGRETLVLMNPGGENDSLVFEETSSIIAEQVLPHRRLSANSKDQRISVNCLFIFLFA